MPLPTSYATASELEEYWRPLSVAEEARASVLLGYAATLINEQPGAADFSAATCKHVSLDMAKRAMIGGSGVSATTQSMADMSARVEHVNPVGNLYLTSQELRRLAGFPPGAFSLTPASNARVPGYRWTYQNSSQTDESD
jgi:hypothetical protein